MAGSPSCRQLTTCERPRPVNPACRPEQPGSLPFREGIGRRPRWNCPCRFHSWDSRRMSRLAGTPLGLCLPRARLRPSPVIRPAAKHQPPTRPMVGPGAERRACSPFRTDWIFQPPTRSDRLQAWFVEVVSLSVARSGTEDRRGLPCALCDRLARHSSRWPRAARTRSLEFSGSPSVGCEDPPMMT